RSTTATSSAIGTNSRKCRCCGPTPATCSRHRASATPWTSTTSNGTTTWSTATSTRRGSCRWDRTCPAGSPRTAGKNWAAARSGTAPRRDLPQKRNASPPSGDRPSTGGCAAAPASGITPREGDRGGDEERGSTVGAGNGHGLRDEPGRDRPRPGARVEGDVPGRAGRAVVLRASAVEHHDHGVVLHGAETEPVECRGGDSQDRERGDRDREARHSRGAQDRAGNEEASRAVAVAP